MVMIPLYSYSNYIRTRKFSCQTDCRWYSLSASNQNVKPPRGSIHTELRSSRTKTHLASSKTTLYMLHIQILLIRRKIVSTKYFYTHFEGLLTSAESLTLLGCYIRLTVANEFCSASRLKFFCILHSGLYSCKL